MTPASRDLIVAVTTHSRNWPYVSEGAASPEAYAPLPGRIYLALGEDGYVSLQRCGVYLWNVHITTLPGARNITERCKNLIIEVCPLLDIRKLFGSIPENNRAARLLARRLGFTEEGRLTRAFLSADNLVDILIYGYSFD